jgi:hypothetical protein
MKSESKLQRAAMDWLKAHNVVHWRMPLGPVVHTIGKRQIWKRNPLKGFPDIAGILTKAHPGVLFTIEFKSSSGRLENEQKHWRSLITSAKARHAVVKSLQDLEQVMVEWGEVAKPATIFDYREVKKDVEG